MKPEFNRRYTDMFEFVPIGFFTFGPADRILEVNPTGANLLRADRSDLIGQPFTKFITEDFQTGFRQHCKKAFESGNRETYDLKLFTKALRRAIKSKARLSLMTCLFIRQFQIGKGWLAAKK